ncbi:glutaredoxin domain-containing protein [Caenimonas terrae]|uniref:Glutaredoxin domain-containing protein n=1 Tax=Caenimonas terrae TaxID=696074 RepID=A0ABW0NJB1_9BURK
MSFARPHVVASLIGLAALMTLAASVNAQQVYRIVGPDGKVTFSDKPPLEANAKQAPVVPLGTGGGAGGASGAGLPFELRQVASKYPVTLYTGNNCGPCGSGRAYLSSRGVPFTEKTITTPEDAQALQRLAGDTSIPMLTVGGQQIKGFSDSEWGQFLDAAGYPARATLPAAYRNPPPAPMVAVQRPAPVPVPEAQPEQARAPSPPPQEQGDNPAGIKF